MPSGGPRIEILSKMRPAQRRGAAAEARRYPTLEQVAVVPTNWSRIWGEGDRAEFPWLYNGPADRANPCWRRARTSATLSVEAQSRFVDCYLGLVTLRASQGSR